MNDTSRGVKNIALMLESDGPGGAEFMLLQLADGLRRRGHLICPVLPTRDNSYLAPRFRDRGIEPEFFTLRRPVDWRCLRGLVDIFERRGVELVHSHEFTMAVYGGAAARLTHLPYVITMHGNRNFAARWRRRVALRWAIRGSIGAAAVSRATGDFIETSLKLAPGSVGVVPNGIDYQPGKRDPVREELGLTPEEPLIVAVGNLYPVKGHIVLLKALGELHTRDPALPWRAAIAGRGREEPNLRAFIAEHGLGDRVRLLGYRNDVPDVLGAADIWVMPSLSEGLPLALLEAMFAGKAIVASRVGGIPEVIQEGRNGFLVEPGDAVGMATGLERLVRDPVCRQAFARAVRDQAVREYTQERMVDSYERLYGFRPPESSGSPPHPAAPPNVRQ